MCAILGAVTVLRRALLLGGIALLVSSVPAPGSAGRATAQTGAGGRGPAPAPGPGAGLDPPAAPPPTAAPVFLPAGPPHLAGRAARYPGPAPDGRQLAFVRSTDRGAGLFSHSLEDGSDTELVAPGQFLALAYPRFSPDGQALAFAAISLLAPIGRAGGETFLDRLG